MAAIVASLIFVGLQMRQDRTVAVGQIYQSTMEAVIALDAAMAEHAEIWAKAERGEDLSETETMIMRRLVNMWRMKTFYESESGRMIDDGDWSAPIIRFAVLLHENPGARRIWIERSQDDELYFGHFNRSERLLAFHRDVQAHLAELEKLDR